MTNLKDMHISHGAKMGVRNGVEIPLSYGDTAREIAAARKHILLTDYSHMGLAEIAGEDAYEVLNTIVGGDVSALRDEQGMYTVLLDEEGKIITDVYILCDEERFIVMTEWLKGDELRDLMQAAVDRYKDEFSEIDGVKSLDGERGVLHFEGPYSWELMAEMFGMDVVGLPFHEYMFVEQDEILFRAGKHGEFSYKLVVPVARFAEVWEQALAAGEKYDMVVGGLEYQRQVRIENPCWDPSALAAYSRCPVELQMQWALRYTKDDFIGKSAIEQRLAQGVTRRAVGFEAHGENAAAAAPGDAVYFGDKKIGEVMVCGTIAEDGRHVGRAMLSEALAYADVGPLRLVTVKGDAELRTTAIPFLRNFSFMVNPSEHSYVDPAKPKHLLEQIERKKQAQAAAN
ncbi:aminomethyltransferase family protein [Paraburkholderia pallida]|uniref:Aminomethyl transferase family protein n=1 Tax=Paraburkholderia pallida TaxID=2547399 RepID=A0A4P7CNE8_9BURK|nr:aminomethyltransferase family protein [Paraburkholderia pallida]QBQ96447.1 aminomethyl transferase family protein [Paraburkholderia pallida]